MSTVQIWQTASSSLEETGKLAVGLGSKLHGGEVIELVSDLGGGKTTFVKGLALGMGSSDQVTSPTFTLNNVYKAGKLTLYHFDFYRLLEPGIMTEELAEILEDPQAVTVVEWAGIVEDVLPAGRLTIRIAATGETARSFSFEYSESLAYLIPDKV
jgi:tRNA threonylcarbamoyladenosine biosynthesis protein TsaE